MIIITNNIKLDPGVQMSTNKENNNG